MKALKTIGKKQSKMNDEHEHEALYGKTRKIQRSLTMSISQSAIGKGIFKKVWPKASE
jgi:hypothetical protein